MGKIIKKYKLKSKHGNENEFEVTRIKVVETRTTMVTDDEGYKISDRRNPKVSTNTKYGIEAVSLPSRLPAEVIPLEVVEANESQALMIESATDTTSYNEERDIDFSEKRPPQRNLTREMYLEENDNKEIKPLKIKTKHLLQNESERNVDRNGITWAEGFSVNEKSDEEVF